MTFIEIIDLITFYGVDVAVLGITTSALTQILKLTLLKSAPKKLYTFLPLITGVLLYTVYCMLAHASFNYAFENLAYILERGFSVSAVATIVYAVYEQFVRGQSVKLPTAEMIVAAMVTDLIEPEKLNTVVQNIDKALESSVEGEAVEAVARILFENAQGDADMESFRTVAMLISETLARLKKTAP